MTEHDWHYTQYKHNKNLPNAISYPDRYADWSITAMFYSALHLINSYCNNRGIPIPTTHHKRSRLVKNELPQIRLAYRNLLTLSQDSRYNHSYLSITNLHVQRAQDYLKVIENHIVGLDSAKVDG